MIKENPKDIGLVIGSKTEAFWTQFKEDVEKDIVDSKRKIELNEHILKFVDGKIKKEKQTFK